MQGVQCALLRKFRITRDFSVTCLALRARVDTRGFEVQTKGVSWSDICTLYKIFASSIIWMNKYIQVLMTLLVNATP